ncbi:MAG: hypothetical protein JXQ66_02350, partial [Campylobacterales bacterium]|nr:hypothetical protein [Campylobacterales bacterium]
LEISELAKIVAKILDKNILFTDSIKGKVDFESNKPIYTDDLLNVLVFVLESKGYTVIENDGILRVVRLNDAAQYNTPVYNNAKKISEYQMVTEVFDIKYSNVDYISSKIRHLISKSAKLVTDKESNVMVLTDFPSNIETIKKVISMVTKDNKKSIEIIDLKNLQGSTLLGDLKNVAKTVFDEKIEKEKVDILLNKDTNSLMFVGKKKNVDYLLEYVKDVDAKGSLVEKDIKVIYLKNAESKSVITILNSLIAKKEYIDKNDRPFASVDEESNSIILMGPKDEIEYFSKLIDELDVSKMQVYVQARIMEVSQLGIRNVGLKYGLNAGQVSGSGIFTMAAELGGMSGSNLILPSGFDLDFGGDRVVTSSVKNNDGTYTNTYGNREISEALALGTTINLLENNDALEIVSEPSILCINNKESSIYIGTTKSIQMGTSTDKNGNATPKLERADIGLTLKVKPRISNENKVILDISAKVEDVSNKQTNAQPDSNKKEITTTAIVNTGESVILGGYTKNKKQNIVDKVPFFGDIPVVGELFKNRVSGEDKINLVIVVTPYIVPQSKDLTYIRDQLTMLKMLEDKFSKDVILQLEKSKLEYKVEDKERQEELEDVQEEIEEFDEDERIEQESGLDAHDRKIQELFGN